MAALVFTFVRKITHADWLRRGPEPYTILPSRPIFPKVSQIFFNAHETMLSTMLGNEIIIYLLLSFIPNLDFKTLVVPIEAHSPEVSIHWKAYTLLPYIGKFCWDNFRVDLTESKRELNIFIEKYRANEPKAI